MSYVEIKLTPKEQNILLQAIRIAEENDEIFEHAKRSELNTLREKLSARK